MESKYEIVGYHGTQTKNAKLIQKQQKFIPGADEDNEDYLGKGIYFLLMMKNMLALSIKNVQSLIISPRKTIWMIYMQLGK